MPGCAVEIGCCQTEPLLWGRIFYGTINLDVPDGTTETVLLSAGIGEADVLCLGISEIYHRRTSQTVLSLVGEGLPVLTVIRCLDEILIELCSVFKLSPDALDVLLLAQVNLDPSRSGGARAPECSVVVIYCIFRTEIVVVVGRGGNLGSEGEVLSHLHLRFQIETFVGWDNLLYSAIGIEFEFIDSHLTMESTVGVRIVVAMIYDVVVVAFLQHAVVSRSVNGTVGIGLEDGAVVGIRTERTLGCCVIHTVAGILAMLAGVEEVVDAVALEDERSLEEVSNLGVRDELGFAERFHIRIQLTCSATEAFVDAPGAPIHIDRTIIISEGLTIQGDGILYESIRYEHGFALAQHILPRTARCITHTQMELARLAVEIVILAVGFVLHHVRCPDPVAVRPVHRHQGPVLEILAAPELCRSETGSATIGSSIYIIGVTKLLDGWVGKIARQDRVACSRSVVSSFLGSTCLRRCRSCCYE